MAECVICNYVMTVACEVVIQRSFCTKYRAEIFPALTTEDMLGHFTDRNSERTGRAAKAETANSTPFYDVGIRFSQTTIISRHNPKIWWFYQQLKTDADTPLELE
jgi:hypothetical protein